ncbi:MAG: ribosomal-processing cysteine protease Prp [Clostridiales bacterium]|nr:ribosomal-processing cysteine protease Prp [Candidatus Equinaster intestinalis]
MTSVEFFSNGKNLTGFSVKGHSSKSCDDFEGRLVCSAVSSAAYMAVNTVTDVIGDKADIEINDALMCVRVLNPSEKSVAVLEGLKLHIEQLACQYGNSIKVISEV